MLIAQISDCHIVEPGGRIADRVDPTPGLRRAVEIVNGFRPAIDVVVGTGDLVNDGRSEQYHQLQSVLADLRPRFIPIPGNHDDRTELRSRFDVVPPGNPDDPIDHVVDLGECRLVCLDTTIPGHHDGRLTDDQLAWLDDALATASPPVIVVQHHPPIPSGIPAMDRRYGLAGAAGEGQVVRRHAHVEAVIGGHYHRALHRRFADTVATCCPSTAVQLALVLERLPTRYSDEPTGLLIHDVSTAGTSSHVVPLVQPTTWEPSWASSE